MGAGEEEEETEEEEEEMDDWEDTTPVKVWGLGLEAVSCLP